MPTYIVKIDSPVPIPIEVLEQVKNSVKKVVASYLQTQVNVEVLKQRQRETLFGTFESLVKL